MAEINDGILCRLTIELKFTHPNGEKQPWQADFSLLPEGMFYLTGAREEAQEFKKDSKGVTTTRKFALAIISQIANELDHDAILKELRPFLLSCTNGYLIEGMHSYLSIGDVVLGSINLTGDISIVGDMPEKLP